MVLTNMNEDLGAETLVLEHQSRGEARCEYSIVGNNCSSARLCGADYPEGCTHARRIGNRMYVCGENSAKEGEKQ